MINTRRRGSTQLTMTKDDAFVSRKFQLEILLSSRTLSLGDTRLCNPQFIQLVLWDA